MDSSDEDFLPDPERSRKRKKPPDHCKAHGSGQLDEPDNQQSGLYLHDDFPEGKYPFSFLCCEVILISELCSD